MAWWDKALSVAKSAVNKAKEAVKKVVNEVSKTASRAVKKTVEKVREVTSTVKKRISKVVEDVKEKTAKVKKAVTETIIPIIKDDILGAGEKIRIAQESIKEEAEKKIEESKENIIKLEEKKEAEETATREVELKELKEKEPTWTEKLMNTVIQAAKIKLPFLKTPKFEIIGNLWERITEKRLAVENSIEVAGHIADWIVPVNAISKLLTGKNIDGDFEEFGGTQDNIDLATGLLMFVPISKVPAIAGKLGAKGFIKFFATKADDAVRMFKLLNVDNQAKLLRGLTKTDDGIKIVNKLLAGRALNPTLVKPTINIVNTFIKNKILVGSGFRALIAKATKPKTILWGLTGMLGAIGSAYGVAFGTEWFAKEGLWELYDFPLGDRMRDYKFEPTAEKAELIQKDIEKLEGAMPKAQSLVRNIAWLWPFTKDAWLTWADGIEFELDQRKEDFARIIVPELIELPEEIKSPIRDIIDGDTIDVSLDGTVKGESFKLPQYKKTGHARIRVVGINSPEKSPKGEIVCTGIEIVSVEKKWADEARNKLLPLNDKEVTLLIDPENRMDSFGRILAVVKRDGEDIGLRQIKEGLACYYFRQAHKFVDDDVYSEETLKAKEDGVGMWKGLEDVEREEDKIKIIIKSSPKNARLFLDDIALRHNTPSDEVELSDVIHLFTLGTHVLSAEKGGLSAMKDIEIVKGDNGEIELILETAPIEAKAEAIEEEVVEEEVVEEEVPEEAPAVAKIEYTTEQEWAMKEAFEKIWELTEGTEVMSRIERETLIESFGLHSDEQKKVLLPLWTNLEILTTGTETLSKDEFLKLLDKHQIVMVV